MPEQKKQEQKNLLEQYGKQGNEGLYGQGQYDSEGKPDLQSPQGQRIKPDLNSKQNDEKQPEKKSKLNQK